MVKITVEVVTALTEVLACEAEALVIVPAVAVKVLRTESM